MNYIIVMQENNHIREHQKRVPFHFLLTALVLIISCTGQDNKNLREIRVIETLEDTVPTSGQHPGTSQVDPLFYIEGQLCAWVRNIFQDSGGNLWFGTNHYGVMRYNGEDLEYFTEKNGLGGGRITGMVEDNKGNMWFGTFGGLTQYDGNSLTNFSVKAGPVDNDVWSVLIDRNGIFWLGTSEGVVQFDAGEFTYFPIPKPEVNDATSILSYNRVSCLLEDKNGLLWFGTDGFGICRYDPYAARAGRSSFTHFTREDGLSDNNVADILEDKNGNIWVGTMFGGISRYDGKSFTNFTLDGMVKGEEVYGLYEDKNGNIWFAAEHHGVYRYDGKVFTNFHKQDGLNTDGVIGMFEDSEGRFWLGGWGGLFRYDPSTDRAGEKSFFSVTKEGPWK